MQLAYAANAYDFANLTASLFGSLNYKPTAEEILATYSKGGVHSGASGDFHFKDSVNGGKHSEFDIVIRGIKDEGTVELYRRKVALN